MKIATTAALLACTVLAACDGATAPTNTVTPAATPDPVEAKINALPPTLQRTAFFRAIQDAGFTCQTIVDARTRTRIEGRPTWVVTCSDKGQYVIVLKPGGIFQVSGVPQPGRS